MVFGGMGGATGGMGGMGGPGGPGGGLSNGVNHSGSPGHGLPFAGIPSELLAGVEKTLAKEPEHPDPDQVFTHQPPADRRVSLKLLLLEHKRLLVIAALLLTTETLTLQAGPLLTGLGVNEIEKHQLGFVFLIGGLYLAAVLTTAVASRSRVRWTGRLAAWVMHDLRIRVFTQLQRMSLDFFTDEKAGVIMTRMTSDIEALQQLLQDGLAQFAIQGLTMVAVTIVLFVESWQLALITVVLVVPILSVFSIWFRNASNRGYLLVRDAIAGVLSDLSETLHGIRVVAAHNRQRHNVLHHRNVVGHYRAANNYTAQIASIYGPGTNMLGVLGQGIILLIGGDMLLHHHLSVGVLTTFILYLGALFQPVQQLVQIYNNFQQGQAAIVKLREFLGSDPSVSESPDAHEVGDLEGTIEFRDVSFGYTPGKLVLEHVNLTIAAGETVAFVGPTGAGKSTMAKLVTRFYDPTSGSILIDGQDLRELRLGSLRRQLGVVPQEPFLFAGTLRDNIAFGRPEATEEELRSTVAAVGLDELVARFPEGLDSVVHERGQSLSSGERQLIALARAFIVQPRVLVLDEATSNLDLQSETQIEAALDVVLEGRTAILIAHRLSTAMRANRIVVVTDGGIAEVGSHAELITKSGPYAEMYATWIDHTRSDHPGDIHVAVDQ
jgi:ATP-binding cassette subfamily B protein